MNWLPNIVIQRLSLPQMKIKGVETCSRNLILKVNCQIASFEFDRKVGTQLGRYTYHMRVYMLPTCSVIKMIFSNWFLSYFELVLDFIALISVLFIVLSFPQKYQSGRSPTTKPGSLCCHTFALVVAKLIQGGQVVSYI